MSVVLPIQTDSRYRTYTATAGQTTFSVEFPFQDDRDIAVCVLDVATSEYVQISDTLYALSGAGNPSGGSLTFTTGRTLGDKILILGQAILERLSSVVRDGRFSSLLIDDEFDRNRLIQQEMARDAKRAIKMEFGAGDGLTIAAGLADGAVLMKEGNRLVEGPDLIALADTAEAARDLAAAYAQTAIQGGTGNSYGVVTGLPALTIPLGVVEIELNGWAEPGDGGGWRAKEIANTGPLLAGQQTSNAGTRRWELTQARTGAVPATALGAFTGTAIQDACDYMARNGGGEVYLPSGSFNSTIDGISVPKDMILRAGKSSLLSAAEPVTTIVKLNEWETVLRDVVFSNAGGNAQYAVMVDKPANAQPVTIEGCLFSGFSRGVNWVDGDMLNLNGNVAYNCELFLDVVNNCMNSNIEDNFVQGGSGFRFDKTTQGAEGVFIGSNRVFPAIAGAFCLRIDAGLEFDIEANVWDQFVGVADPEDGAIAAVSFDAAKHGDGSVRLIKSAGNWMGRNGSAANAKIGMFIGGPCRLIESLNDTYTGWQQAALEVDGPCVDIIIRGAKFYDGDRSLRDINLTNASRVIISGCKFSGYASIIENAGVDGRVDMCTWADGAPLPPTISDGLKYGRQAAGMTLRNQFELVMTAAGTPIIFTHGLDYEPKIWNFRTVKGSPSNNSHLSIHDISATSATLAVNVAPPADFSVGIECDMER